MSDKSHLLALLLPSLLGLFGLALLPGTLCSTGCLLLFLQQCSSCLCSRLLSCLCSCVALPAVCRCRDGGLAIPSRWWLRATGAEALQISTASHT